MAECTYCGDIVGMPHKCKLCTNKYCSKHRLPEKHECVNIAAYSTPEYRTIKVQKSNELREIKSSVVESENSLQDSLSKHWLPDSDFKAILAVAGVLSLINILKNYKLLNFLGFNIVLSLILMFAWNILFSGIVFKVRDVTTKKYGGLTQLILYPAGIAVSLLSSLLSFTLIVFTRFVDQPLDLEEHAKIGLNTIISLVIISLSTLIIPPLISLLFQFTSFALTLSTAYVIAGMQYFWLAIILYIPWGNLDGRYIYTLNQRNYFIGVVVMIVLFVMLF